MNHRVMLAAAGFVTVGAACGGAFVFAHAAQVPAPVYEGLPPRVLITAKGAMPTPYTTPRGALALTPSPKPSPSPSPEPSLRVVDGRAQPQRVKVPHKASGRYKVVPGSDKARKGRGPVIKYLVEVEKGLPFKGAEFAEAVHRILNDRRGWGRFQRVSSGSVRIRVALSSPRLTDAQCLPLRTGGVLSCWNGRRAVLNARRWGQGSPNYGRDLASYREYMVGHEVGHGLGHGHVYCPGRGRKAPVMVQQTKSVGSCEPNPWPFPKK